MAPANKNHKAQREAAFISAPFEKKALPWLAKRLPNWVLPDHLTFLGIICAIGIGLAYMLSNESVIWLWAASALLIVHWFGDSLDGTLARVRGIERPKYGYYLDHLTDAFSTAVICIGLGLSPYMLLTIGLGLAVAYLILSINVYLEASTFGKFKLGYSLVGPTEARVGLIIVNTLLALGVGLNFHIDGIGLTVLDVIGAAAIGSMLVMLVARAAQNLRNLAHEEPVKGPTIRSHLHGWAGRF